VGVGRQHFATCTWRPESGAALRSTDPRPDDARLLDDADTTVVLSVRAHICCVECSRRSNADGNNKPGEIRRFLSGTCCGARVQPEQCGVSSNRIGSGSNILQ
jgi:hypothetical protein